MRLLKSRKHCFLDLTTRDRCVEVSRKYALVKVAELRFFERKNVVSCLPPTSASIQPHTPIATPA
jgi:hypothetical protein